MKTQKQMQQELNKYLSTITNVEKEIEKENSTFREFLNDIEQKLKAELNMPCHVNVYTNLIIKIIFLNLDTYFQICNEIITISTNNDESIDEEMFKSRYSEILGILDILNSESVKLSIKNLLLECELTECFKNITKLYETLFYIKESLYNYIATEVCKTKHTFTFGKIVVKISKYSYELRDGINKSIFIEKNCIHTLIERIIKEYKKVGR